MAHVSQNQLTMHGNWIALGKETLALADKYLALYLKHVDDKETRIATQQERRLTKRSDADAMPSPNSPSLVVTDTIPITNQMIHYAKEFSGFSPNHTQSRRVFRDHIEAAFGDALLTYERVDAMFQLCKTCLGEDQPWLVHHIGHALPDLKSGQAYAMALLFQWGHFCVWSKESNGLRVITMQVNLT